jgi:hypothetical protein
MSELELTFVSPAPQIVMKLRLRAGHERRQLRRRSRPLKIIYQRPSGQFDLYLLSQK